MTYFFLPVTARIFESGMILVLLAGLSLDSYRKVCFFLLCSSIFACSGINAPACLGLVGVWKITCNY